MMLKGEFTTPLSLPDQVCLAHLGGHACLLEMAECLYCWLSLHCISKQGLRWQIAPLLFLTLFGIWYELDNQLGLLQSAWKTILKDQIFFELINQSDLYLDGPNIWNHFNFKTKESQDCSSPADAAGSHVTTQKPLCLSALLTPSSLFVRTCAWVLCLIIDNFRPKMCKWGGVGAAQLFLAHFQEVHFCSTMDLFL